jgi:2-keto-4-pentenoate hydratase/2-oxohepta-3-ene-1,7-dioic acid hydratase in catechol pathway
MKKLVRFQHGQTTAYGVLEGDGVQPIDGDLFGSQKPSGANLPLSGVKLLFPVKPTKIFAVGLNYKSHLGSRTPPAQPEIFYKPISALQNPGDPIVTPPQSKNMHFEGEIVAVIGQRASRISVDEARAAVLGVTCGNDVSERDWQGGPAKDLQWWRAKGSDTFAPLGPCIVTGIDYGNLLLTTKVNGNVVQKQYTSDLLFDIPTVVSFISQWVTLEPGDIIYTGTPGSTSKLNPGDVVEIEIEGIGVLRNPVE